MVHSASEARANLYRLIDQVVASHEPVRITGKRGTVVVVAEDDWRALQATLHLLSVPGMRDSIRRGMAAPLAESSERLPW
ncbi:MAG: type II toxin-antitoxin system Phd/YefM family antitoxin [Gammaproteobacteria bacterium]